MVDLHNHLLFGMDDGAKNLDNSLELFKMQKTQGVSHVIMTPHVDAMTDLPTFLSKRAENYQILQRKLQEAELDVNLKVGAEILYTQDILNMNLDKLVIEDSDYLLIEFPTRGYINNLERNIYSLLDMGYQLIFAHVERYAFLREDLKLMANLVNSGVVFQVNASSFLDESQKGFLKAAIKHNLIHLVASDAHSLERRPPNISKAYEQIEKDYGKETVRMFKKNAMAVFNNDTIAHKEASPMRLFLGKYY